MMSSLKRGMRGISRDHSLALRVRELLIGDAEHISTLRVPSRVTRWPSGWNVERQKHDYEDQD